LNVYVVYDAGGAGRVVGVFRSPYRANSVVAINPAYYRVTQCRLDDVTDAAFEWLESLQQRDQLERLRALRT